MGYDASKASAYNKLIQSGLSPEVAATQAGISAAERGNYAVTGRFNNDGTPNPNPGTLGPKIATKQNDLTEEDGALFARSGFNTQAEARDNAAFFKGAGGSDDFDDKPSGVARVKYQQKPDATNTAPGKVVASDYTTTSTETVSGGGTTTIVATPATSTPASRAAQAQADATLKEIESLQLQNSGFGSGPPLTEAQMAANDAKILQLTEQYDRQRATATSSQVPGLPSVTTVPNTTTTVSTTVYETSASNTPLTKSEISEYQQLTATRVNETGAKFQEPFVSDQAAAAEAAYYEANPAEVRAVLASAPPAEPIVTTTSVEITDAELFAPANTTNTNPGPGYTAPGAAEPTDGELYRKPLGIGGNYTTSFNPETGTYDVVNLDNGQVVESGLSELNAEVTASQFSQGDPQFETPEMPPELPDVTEPDPPGGNFGSVFDPETQSWSVIDNDTGVIVQTGFNDAASAELQAQLDSQPDPYANQFTDDDINASFTESDLVREPTDQDVIENDARITGENVGIVRTEPAPVGLTESEVIGDFSADPRIAGENVGLDTPAVVTDAARNRAQVQATLANQQRQADSGDWRFKIRLAPGARYLYRGDNGQGVQSGILAPLAVTDGVVFPYTPQVSTNYSARYTEADLPHSNYRGYFYNTSYVDSVQIEGTFTAQDTAEANYLLAVIHFFRSVTKMFYGQASEFRGAPPPLVFLQGFGAYQFSRHPCVISSFRYTLPRDVDYIRADVQPISGLNIQQQRKPGGVPPQSLPTNVFTGALARLAAAGVPKGAVFRPQAPDTLGTRSPTYVPTKMDITLELLPMQTRQQVSQEFNNRDFATGALQKKGFW